MVSNGCVTLSKCSWLSRQLTFWLGDSNLKIKFMVAWKLMMGKIFKLQKVVAVYTRQFTNFPNLYVVSLYNRRVETVAN